MIRMISWNTRFARQPWFDLLDMDIDIALLQETCTPPLEVRSSIELSPYSPWLAEFFSQTALRPPRVVRVSDRVKVEWYEQVAPHRGTPGSHQMPVSGIGLCDAAIVAPIDGGNPFNVVSMYAAWQRSHPNVGARSSYPDASAHRIISDLTVLVPTYAADGQEHRTIAAGDLNMCFGDSDSFATRAQTVFDRMRALGLKYVGPRYPNGRKADPVPKILAEDSLDVPTYYSNAMTPETAQLQLDHSFHIPRHSQRREHPSNERRGRVGDQ